MEYIIGSIFIFVFICVFISHWIESRRQDNYRKKLYISEYRPIPAPVSRTPVSRTPVSRTPGSYVSPKRTSNKNYSSSGSYSPVIYDYGSSDSGSSSDSGYSYDSGSSSDCGSSGSDGGSCGGD